MSAQGTFTASSLRTHVRKGREGKGTGKGRESSKASIDLTVGVARGHMDGSLRDLFGAWF